MKRCARVVLILMATASAVTAQVGKLEPLQRALSEAVDTHDFERANHTLSKLALLVADIHLRVAIAEADTSAVAEALSAGADPNSYNAAGVSMLAAAAAQCQDTEPIVEQLLRAGADPAQGHYGGQSALEVAAQSSEGCPHVFVRHGMEVDVSSADALRAMISGIRAGDQQVVTILLDGGLDIHSLDPQHDEWSLLLHAVDAGQDQVASLLLEWGAHGETALATARASGDASLAERLEQALQLAGDSDTSRQRKQSKK